MTESDRPRGSLAWVLSLLVLGLAAPVAQAQDSVNHLYDRLQVTLSGSLLKLGSELRVDSKDGRVGTNLNLEDDLGFDRSKIQPRAEIRWKPGRHHQIDAGYQFARRTAPTVLDGSIEVGDTIFVDGATLESLFNSDNAFLTYRWAILARDRSQFGLGIGLGAFFFKVGIDAVADVSGGGGQQRVAYSSDASFVGPTASAGLFARLRAGSRWYLAPEARYLSLRIDQFRGEIFEANVLVKYFVSRRFGIEGGVGVRAVQVEARSKPGDDPGSEFKGRVKYFERQLRLGALLSL